MLKAIRILPLIGWFIVFPLAGIFLFPKLVYAEIAASHLVISEIQTSGGPGLTANDFVEIYNPTEAAVDLSGHRLVKRTQNGTSDTSLKSWTTSIVIPAKSFYLWANSGYTALAADSATSYTIADDNAVALRFGEADTGQIVDSVGWGSNASGLAESSAFAENIPAGQSLERASDTDNNAIDLTIQTTPTPRNLASGPLVLPTAPPAPTPIPAALPTAPLQIFISEVLPDPEGKDSGFEWVELFNAGTFEADISGWVLDDEGIGEPGSTAFRLPADSKILPGQRRTFFIPSGRFALNNDTDTVRLFNADKKLVDQITYQEGEEGLAFAKAEGNIWSWSAIITPGTANQFLASLPSPSTTYENYEIVFNEIFGNPKGADSGHEWLELANVGEKEIDLSGWFLDDEGKTKSGNAYRLPSGSVVEPGGILLVNLPATLFTITNSEEEIRLLTPEGDDLISIFVPEFEDDNLSFARLVGSDDWQFSFLPTPGEANKFIAESRQVSLSEIYFMAEENEEPYLELYNSEEKFVNLSGWRLSLNERQYVFPDGASIAPKTYLIINLDETSLRISKNNYLELVFERPAGEVHETMLGRLAEGSARAGSSVIVERGKIVWTNSPTPGQKNKITKPVPVSPAVEVKPIAVPLSPALATPIVAGESAGVSVDEQEENELPIIIEKKSNKGFFHRVGGFLCLKWGLCI